MKMVLRGVALASLVVINQAHALIYGQTFFPIRPVFEVARPEYVALFRDFRDVRKNGHGASFELVPFGGSTNKGRDIAQYLLPNGSDTIVVGEDLSQAARDWSTDINAYNLGILTYPLIESYELGNLTFQSTVKFCPKQRIAGLGLAYHQRMPRCTWFEIAAPLVYVENRLNMCECISNAGGGDVPEGAFSNFIDAMGDCNTKRCYGRMTNRPLRKTRLSHVDVRVGYDAYSSAQCLHGWFVGLDIPTGNKPCARYLFEPIVGNNHHWGMVTGTFGSHEITHDSKGRSFVFNYESVLRYLFENKQWRSFDLKHRPWSRYMAVYTDNVILPEWSEEQAVINNSEYLDYLINYTTLCVCVKPHYRLDLAMGMNYKDAGFNVEVGANLCVQHNEEICMCGCFDPKRGIAAMRTWSDSDVGSREPKTRTTALPNSTVFAINNDPVGDPDVRVQIDGETTPVYRPITINDLDLNSAACPGYMSQIVYASLGYIWKDARYPVMFNAGGSYEWGHENAAVERWLLWLKFGLAF